MLLEQTLEILRTLKLSGMAQGLQQQMEQPKSYDLSFEERLSLLVDDEQLHRKNKKLNRLLKTAKLRQEACMEDIDYCAKRGLKKEQIASLMNGYWVKKSLNMVITGATGTGKSWLACAFGNQICRQGLSVLYLRFSKLSEGLRVSRLDGTYSKYLKQILKPDLLILDDWLLEPLGQKNLYYDILEIVEERHERKSLLLSTQMPVANWHELIGEPTVADAILDRILGRSIKFEMKGDSMRKVKKMIEA